MCCRRQRIPGKPVGHRHCPATVGAASIGDRAIDALHESERRPLAAPLNRRGIRVRSSTFGRLPRSFLRLNERRPRMRATPRAVAASVAVVVALLLAACEPTPTPTVARERA